MATTTRTKSEIQAEISNLLKIEVHVETNQGTYGGVEAARKIGTGDPAYANREVYETVGGIRRETGSSEADSIGRMRKIGYESLSDYRKQLAALRAELKAAKA